MHPNSDNDNNLFLTHRFGGVWIIPAGTQLAAEEYGGPPPHVLSSSHHCTTGKHKHADYWLWCKISIWFVCSLKLFPVEIKSFCSFSSLWYVMWSHRHLTMTSLKRRKGQGGGDPKTVAKTPRPHYRYNNRLLMNTDCWYPEVLMKGK